MGKRKGKEEERIKNAFAVGKMGKSEKRGKPKVGKNATWIS